LTEVVDSLRRRLIVFAAGLLTCQLAVLTVAPVLLYQTKAAAAGSELLCDCKVEPGAECPMHGSKAHGATGRKTARFSPVCGDQAAAVLTLIASGTGILAAPSHVVRPATNPVAVLVLADSVLDAARPPTSPPPRG
jgi:DNA-binding transcriptional LysR family regulator